MCGAMTRETILKLMAGTEGSSWKQSGHRGGLLNVSAKREDHFESGTSTFYILHDSKSLLEIDGMKNW